MKTITRVSLFVLILFSCVNAFPQYCNTDRFTEKPVFTGNEIDSSMNVVYGAAADWQRINEELKFNVYYPKVTLDTLQVRPFVMLMHGGSFLTGSLDELNFFCREFAMRGYVAATIEYRVGWDYLPDCNGDTVTLANAVYRAMQDCHAALRYFVANFQSYRIDTATMFIGGESAGAYATVDLAFVSQQEINGLYPWCQPLLGNLNASGNTLTNSFTVKGLFHNWGSIINLGFLTPGDAVPMVAFAGAQDTISHIDSGYYQNCSNYPMDWGTRSIYNRLVSFGVCADLTVKEDGGHGVYNHTPGQKLFRIGRACCFFKSLFCHDCVTWYSTDSVAPACSDKYLNTAVDNRGTNPLIEISPNPAGSHVMIRTRDPELAGSPVTIFDSAGRVIQGSRLDGLFATLDTSNLAEGVYFILVNHLAGTKLIITRH